MRKLKVTFPSNLSEEQEALRAQVYWDEFKSISIDRFEFAINSVIGDLKFFPKPAELWEALRSPSQSESEPKRIDWAEPTEQGRQVARECINFLLNNIGEKEEKDKKEREKRFEQRRSELRKQAKTLMEVA